MVFTASLRKFSAKQDLSSINCMLSDQQATYVILRYAQDVPDSVYNKAMFSLAENEESLFYRKLVKLVKAYKAASSIKMEMDEEFVETIEIPVGYKTEDALVDSCWDEFD